MSTKKTRTFLVGGIVIGLAGLICLAVAGVIFLINYIDRTSPRIVDVTPSKGTTAKTYSLTDPQQEVLNRLGPPPAFTISFYQEDTGDQGAEEVRRETWTYYDQGKEVVFINGEQVSDAEIEVDNNLASPTPYRPEQFSAYATLNEITAVLGGRMYLSVPLENELVPGGTVYYTDQLILGLKNDRLRSIQALALFTED